jgi:regulator of sigma E protease
MLSVLWDWVLPFLVVLTILVFVHELGHYWVARRAGVRVEVFSVGFGRELWGWTDRLGTRWKLGLIPVGGYVKFFGEQAAGESVEEALQALPPEDRAVAFHGKSVGRRFAIVAAGPLANLLFAFVLLVGLFVTVGQPYTPPEVMAVLEDSAAEEAGFRPGDRIVRIDGDDIERFEQMQTIIGMAGGQTLTVVVLRDGAEVVLEATPRVVEEEDPFGNKQRIGRLGVSRTGVEYRRLGPVSASVQAVRQMVTIVGLTGKALGQMIAGSRSSQELRGPLGIAQMSGQVAQSGVVPVIWFMALLSINLGLINLFPIPVLDGGHLVFYAIEAIRGKPVGERIQDYSFRIGLALVLTLMIFATWNDLVQFKFFDFLSGLFS